MGQVRAARPATLNDPLRLVMSTRSGEHQLLPGEFIELRCASDVVEIEQTETELIVNDRAAS